MDGLGLLTFLDDEGDLHAIDPLAYARLIVVASTGRAHLQLITAEGRPEHIPLGDGEAEQVMRWLQAFGVTWNPRLN